MPRILVSPCYIISAPFRLLLAVLCPLLLHSCSEEPFSTQEPQLVVEGWIDEEGAPIVFVTTSVPFSSTSDTDYDMSSHLVRWAKVTVSDGDTTVVLTGKFMKRYTPSYGYTTGEMFGRCGRTYRLTVDYESYHAEAVTTIPPRASIAYFEKVLCAESDTLYELQAHIANTPPSSAAIPYSYAYIPSASGDTPSASGDTPSPSADTSFPSAEPSPSSAGASSASAVASSASAKGYKFFVMRKGKDTYYQSCNMGLYAASHVKSGAPLPVFQAHRYAVKDYTPYFSLRDTLYVKLATVDGASYRFWQSYEESVSLSRTPFFATGNNLQSNLRGALGYWCGYGRSEYEVLPEDGKAEEMNNLKELSPILHTKSKQEVRFIQRF